MTKVSDPTEKRPIKKSKAKRWRTIMEETGITYRTLVNELEERGTPIGEVTARNAIRHESATRANEEILDGYFNSKLRRDDSDIETPVRLGKNH